MSKVLIITQCDQCKHYLPFTALCLKEERVITTADIVDPDTGVDQFPPWCPLMDTDEVA